MSEDKPPPIKFCPYCGSDHVVFLANGREVKEHFGVPRCRDCRAVFFVTFSRICRKSPNKR